MATSVFDVIHYKSSVPLNYKKFVESDLGDDERNTFDFHLITLASRFPTVADMRQYYDDYRSKLELKDDKEKHKQKLSSSSEQEGL